MPQLILIRGLPGSGKSTLASDGVLFKRMAGETLTHLEADMYFMRNGEYHFVPEWIGKAHQACQDACRALLQLNKSVVVSNTFTTIKEMEMYVDMRHINNAELSIYECKGNYGSIHNVPAFAMQRMIDRWQELPDEWVQYRRT